jgi:hypothetical protein
MVPLGFDSICKLDEVRCVTPVKRLLKKAAIGSPLTHLTPEDYPRKPGFIRIPSGFYLGKVVTPAL